ncbi:hypothetical protein C2845_PM04G29490 [Panicum miliaceum]|uniref:Uncharacterized protein n=1 Tax=Panicum miliaceum TaxID=4540 RepID=A0A3L6QV27_PANMI|nr:hypothetical protein C2845_PM04G29490 [Panicum miliaceum]
MALAPSERSRGDGGGDSVVEPPDRLTAATPPPHARTTPTPATASRCRSPAASSSHPAPRARPRLDGRRSDGAQLRTGVSRRPGGCTFQDRLLRDFYSTAVPGAIVPSSPAAPLWATPGPASVRYSLAFVTNMLNYLLTVCPGRLFVTRVCPRVFRFVVANRNIAHVLAVRGWLCLGASVLHLHASMEEAVRAAGKVVEDECDTPNAAATSDAQGSRPVAQGESNSASAETFSTPEISGDTQCQRLPLLSCLPWRKRAGAQRT